MSSTHLFDLTGKVTAVIGGGSGIGKAVTLGAVRMGATVVCLDVAHDAAAAVAAEAGGATESGTVDITDSASVWKVHEDAHGLEEDDRQTLEDEREVTMALVRYTSPLAAVTFPRWGNTTTEMQAAAPALEVTRLLHMLGLGTDVLRAFAGLLLFTAGLSVFIALWNAVRERRGDLALLRMLGAPASRIAALLMAEALWLALLCSR